MNKQATIGIPLALIVAAGGVRWWISSRSTELRSVLDKVNEAHKAGAYRECLDNLQTALQLVRASRIRALRDALPAAPLDLKIQESDGGDASLLLGRRYQSDDGEKRISVNVHADSPPIAALLPMIMNPMLVQASNGEILEYGKNKAVLLKQGVDGKSWKLQIVIDQARLVEVDAAGVERETLLKMFDGPAVGRIAKELGS